MYLAWGNYVQDKQDTNCCSYCTSVDHEEVEGYAASNYDHIEGSADQAKPQLNLVILSAALQSMRLHAAIPVSAFERAKIR